MKKVFITRLIPDEGIKILKEKGYTVAIYPKDQIIPRKELLQGVKGAHALIPDLTDKIDAEVFEAAGPQLKIVANYAVGVDNIDLAMAKKYGVFVSNTPGVLTNAVAEHAFALILALARRIVESDKFTRAGNYQGWGPMLFLGTELNGKTLGIVGLGRIGFAVTERAVKGFGMKVIYSDPKQNREFDTQYGARYVELSTLLKESDFVTLHVPLLPSTRHLINAKNLKLMKKTAFLINTARGPVVDERALVAALKQKQIAGAALDVFEHEPKLSPGLTKLDNVVLTPHIASATWETRQAMSRTVAANIIAAFSGQTPPHLVS